jgi:hypothetical protein
MSEVEVDRGEKLGKPFKPSKLLTTSILVASITVTATVVYIATFRHSGPSSVKYIFAGALACVAATITPIWLERWVFNGASYQLLIVAWRLGTMLFALAVSSQFSLPERNYIITTLLACYFVTLPLESWLLALRTRP